MTETAILTDSQIINSPTLNFNGPDIFAYTIRDNAPVNRLATESLLQLILLPVNEVAILANETCLLPIDALVNDLDVDDDHHSLQ